jgi:membrane protease YdiL (CAAX protease family)
VEELLRDLVTLGLTGLLCLLRLEAATFGAAEYDEPASDDRRSTVRTRIAWYLLGLGLVAAVLFVHPAPGRDLELGLGDRGGALLGGFALGVIGTGQAVLFARIRYGRLRMPPLWSYPGAVLNAIGTAFIDEATFRGLVLGFLLLAGVDPALAIIMQALLYVLATRTGAPGRGRYAFGLALFLGFAAGWLTTLTGGIGAAFLGHAVTRIAVFVCTGHAGQPAPRGYEVEDSWEFRRSPDGWRQMESPGEEAKADR